MSKITQTIIQGDGFYISYVSNPGGDFDVFKGDNGSDETALVKEEKSGTRFYILNGDYRKNYRKLIKEGYKECKKFFNSKKKFKSSWSN